MRDVNFTKNEYYHLYGRGVNRQKLFYDDADKARFLFLTLHLQSPTPINNTGYYVNSFIKKGSFGAGTKKLKDVMRTRYLDVISFAIIPDSFHILVKSLGDGIVSVYMHRVLTSYSKYLNAKLKRKGHVFEGPFKATHLNNNREMLNASAYIHKNITGAEEEISNYEDYEWSSYRDFIENNRWGKLLSTDAIIGQFKNKDLYKDFVSTNKENVLDF